jgi:hypothetical protein
MSTKRFWLTNCLIAAILTTILVISWFLWNENFELIAILCGVAMFFSFFSSFLSFSADHQYGWIYGEFEFKATSWNSVYRTLPYASINSICICRATGKMWNYIKCLDENKKPKAIIVMSEDFSDFVGFNSKGYGTYPTTRLQDCSSFLEESDLLILLEKTQLPIYVTEEMFLLHSDKMEKALNTYPDRFIIAYYDRARSCEKKAPYRIYQLYRQN